MSPRGTASKMAPRSYDKQLDGASKCRQIAARRTPDNMSRQAVGAITMQWQFLNVEPFLGTADVVALCACAQCIRHDIRSAAVSLEAPRGLRWVQCLKVTTARSAQRLSLLVEPRSIEQIEVCIQRRDVLENAGILSSLLSFLAQLGSRCHSIRFSLDLPTVVRQEIAAGSECDDIFYQISDILSNLWQVKHFSLALDIDANYSMHSTVGDDGEENVRLQFVLLENLLWLLCPWLETIEELDLWLSDGSHGFMAHTHGLLLFYILSMPCLRVLRCVPSFSLGDLHNCAIDLIRSLDVEERDAEEEDDQEDWLLWRIYECFGDDVRYVFDDNNELDPEVRRIFETVPTALHLQLCRVLVVLHSAIRRSQLLHLEISLEDKFIDDANDCGRICRALEFLLREHPTLRELIALPICDAYQHHEPGRCDASCRHLIDSLGLHKDGKLCRLCISGGAHLSSEIEQTMVKEFSGRLLFARWVHYPSHGFSVDLSNP